MLSFESARVNSNGLRKALCSEARDIVAFYLNNVSKDLLVIPVEKQGWRKGSFSWHYVTLVSYWSGVMFSELEKLVMPRPTKKQKTTNNFDKFSFVRCELNSEDKKTAKIWIDENTPDMGAIVHDAIAEGYKLSVSFSTDHDTFTASMTGKEDCVNEYKTLTARHREWITAVMTVLYKHNVMFKAGVWETEEPSDDGWA